MIAKIESIRRINLQQIVDKIGSWNKLSSKLNKNQGYLNGVKNGTRPFSEKLAREIEQKLGLDDGVLDKHEGAQSQNVVIIPVYASLTEDIKVGEIPISIEEIGKANTKLEFLIALKAQGNSMQPTINDSSTVLIDTTQKEIVDNKIYAFTIDDHLIKINRLRKGLDGVIVQSDNPDYSEEKVLYSSNIKIVIIGRVIWVNNKL